MSEPTSEFALQLNEALSDAALAEFDGPPDTDVSQQARRAAYELAVALGRCRMFGADDAIIDDKVLTDRVAEAASRVFREALRDWIELAKQLGENFDEAEPFEDVDHCADTVHCRMEAWAAFLALNEAYQESLELVDRLDAKSSAWMDEVLQLIEELDESLQTPDNLLLLSTVTSWRLLDNLRAMLAEPYREILPWWLDGRLEEIAGRTQQVGVEGDFDGPTRLEELESQNVANAPQYALAAGGGETANAVIAKFACVSSTDAPTNDYRRAWAHFFAATYLGTSHRDDWRTEFVKLASSENSLDTPWIKRAEQAKALAGDRDWKRRYEGDKIFALEPEPLKDASGLAKLLSDLAGSDKSDVVVGGE